MAVSQEETERYRRAAEEALDQLAWCVRYLERIRKPQLAEAIARNIAAIQRELRK